MTHADITRGYSDNALRGIVRDLTRSGAWDERLRAAKQELTQRNREDTETTNSHEP